MKKFFALVFLLLSINIQSTETNSSVLDILANSKVQTVDLLFVDPINADLKEIMIPINQFISALESGLSFDSSSIPGFGNTKGKAQITQSDMVLKLDLDTISFLPWTPENERAARFMCDVYIDEENPYLGDPRTILKNVLAQAHEMGYEFFVGPEIEFFLTKAESEGKKSLQNLVDQGVYSEAQTNLMIQRFKRTILSVLQAQGINVEKWHHEVAPGQHEISIKYKNALGMADEIVLTRHTMKTVAQNAGLCASFMPKPLFEKNGSGLHINFSLFDTANNRNAFFDENDQYKLSQIAHYFIAGVLKRTKEITLLLNPTINSYKRLVPGFEAPRTICWGGKNRSSTMRIPLNRGQANATRGELRSPDSACNPYLAFAAVLQAGLEGIKNKEQLMPATEENVFLLNEEQLRTRNIDTLPANLDEAIQLFEQSEFAHNLLGDQLFNEIIRVKREELRAFNTQVTDWEIEKYF